MNNKILVGFNIVLLIALVVLYVLFFKNKSTVGAPSIVADTHSGEVVHEKNNEVDTSTVKSSLPSGSLKIAYFDEDSIFWNYTYYKNVRKSLMARENQIQSQLAKMKSTFVAKAKEYSEKGPSLSQTEQMNYQKELSQLRDEYGSREQELGQQFQDEQNRRILEVKSRIQKFLKGYSRQKGYAFVFSAGSGGNDNIYYKDSVNDITKDLLKGLNASPQ